MTGLSGSGKSTLAYTLDHALANLGKMSYVLDGDNVRHGLNKNLGFRCSTHPCVKHTSPRRYPAQSGWRSLAPVVYSA